MTLDMQLVVVGADWDSLRRFDLTHVDVRQLVLVCNQPQESLASIANELQDTSDMAVVGLAHADVFFRAGALEEFQRVAMTGSVCGVVGVSDDDKQVWCFQGGGEVQTLDSCAVFMPNVPWGVRFDECTFDGLHCHVQDLCMQAHHQGFPVVVPSCDATHQGLNFDRPKWREDFDRYHAKLDKKWRRKVKCT